MENKKMNPILMIVIGIIVLNILGFVLKVLVQTASLAVLILAGYLLDLKFIKKP